MNKKLFFVFCLGLIFCLNGAVPVFACVGARPLAMGGAFIAVADDANTTYWNPAGLTQMEEFQATYTATLHERDEVNYDDFVSLTFPFKFEDTYRGSYRGGVGLSFVNSGFKSEPYEINDRWLWVSGGLELPGGLSLGVNLRQSFYEWKINNGWFIIGSSPLIIGPTDDMDSAFAFDLSALWRWDKFSVGVLWQDVNEPEFSLFGGQITLQCVSNLRLGAAFRPDDKTVLSFEIYDIYSKTQTSEHDIRLGAERRFDLPIEGSSVALRGGVYNVNADDESNRAITWGVGLEYTPKARELDCDYPVTVKIDYAMMYWTDMPDGYSDTTHFLGITASVPWG